MSGRDELMHEAATMYYLQDATMETIGRQLRMSRSGVSRLLKAARERGMVQVQVRAPGAGGAVARRVEQLFGVRAHVVPVRSPLTDDVRLDHVARYAAQLLQGWFGHGMTLGLAWGTTVAAVSTHLVPTPIRDAVVVQLNGAANTLSSGLAYGTDLVSQFAQSFGAVPEHFPVPAFFDYAATREQMWRERSVRHVLGVQARADLAVFGVGALVAPVPSHVYTSGYLEPEDREALAADGVVGDVCTVFLREDGSWEDVAINDRATGPTPRQLQAIHRRVCVVAGEAKVVPLRAALRAGAATDLVIDEPTANALVRGTMPG
ncbi:sugar-binding transcriptional regulator [Litorihabitans aurantiacus]|uniref:Transcriptional regulator n=1 Tax=Litorihabitans aurantiacus TaxID=1930061 RepID=A0AA37XCX7_9MICO|nr:sugar-binding domain-containing protein [Litorihabitans aurantiacus]GMA30313.1 transcriptional regulator [Litorihabitans aurantiacus]